MFNDPGNPKRMVQDFNRIACLDMFALRKIIVHQHLVLTMKRAALQVMEWAAERLKAIEIDSVKYLRKSAASHGKLHDHGRNNFDVWQFGKNVSDLNGGGRTG